MTRCCHSLQRLVTRVSSPRIAARPPNALRNWQPTCHLHRTFGTAQEIGRDEARSSHKPPPYSSPVAARRLTRRKSDHSPDEPAHEDTKAYRTASDEALDFILAGYEEEASDKTTAGDDALDMLLGRLPTPSEPAIAVEHHQSDHKHSTESWEPDNVPLLEESMQRNHESNSLPEQSTERVKRPMRQTSSPSGTTQAKRATAIHSRTISSTGGEKDTKIKMSRKRLSRVGTTVFRLQSVQRRRREAARAGTMPPLASRATLKRRQRQFFMGKQSGRKFVRVDPSREDMALLLGTWNPNFAKVHRAHDQLLKSQQAKPPILNVHTAQWVEKAYERMEHEELLSPWKIGPQGQMLWSNEVAAQILLWFLYYDKWTIPAFLQQIHTELRLPMACLGDCLMHLVADLRRNGDFSEARSAELLNLIVKLAQRSDGRTMTLQSGTVRTLIQYLGTDDVNTLYYTIKANKVDVSWFTYLHFSSYFAKHDHFDQALDAILSSCGVGADLDSYAFLSVCATLLRQSVRQPGGLRVCLRIIPNFVELGLKLNIQLCNIIMLNAVEMGDLKVALSVHDSLRENGLRPDHYTTCILLKACKIDLGNADMLNSVIRSAIENIDVVRAPIVASEILHCLALHHTNREEDADKSYETIIEAYLQLFDEEPLHQLGLPIPPRARETPVVRRTAPPTNLALNIVLAVCRRPGRRHAPSFRKIYRQFRELAQRGIQPFADLATTDHFANNFLMALMLSKSGMLHATEVIRDMQRPLPESSGVKQCAPTVQTWSILLAGFTRHGQTHLAEKILSYMQRDGIEPNRVTWNSLLHGYAENEDINGMLETVRSMDERGIAWDEFTHKSLNRLRSGKQIQFRERLEEMRSHGGLGGRAAALDFSDEIKGRLVERVTQSRDSQPDIGDAPQSVAGAPDQFVESKSEAAAVRTA